MCDLSAQLHSANEKEDCLNVWFQAPLAESLPSTVLASIASGKSYVKPQACDGDFGVNNVSTSGSTNSGDKAVGSPSSGTVDDPPSSTPASVHACSDDNQDNESIILTATLVIQSWWRDVANGPCPGVPPLTWTAAATYIQRWWRNRAAKLGVASSNDASSASSGPLQNRALYDKVADKLRKTLNSMRAKMKQYNYKEDRDTIEMMRATVGFICSNLLSKVDDETEIQQRLSYKDWKAVNYNLELYNVGKSVA